VALGWTGEAVTSAAAPAADARRAGRRTYPSVRRQRWSSALLGGGLGLGSGALIGIGFRVPSCAPLVFVALVPLLWATRLPAAVATLAGAAAGVAAYATLFAWLPISITRFGGFAPREARLLFGLGVACHALQFVAFAVAAMLAGRVVGPLAPQRVSSAVTLAIAWAACWVAVERMFPMAIPWSLGAALSPHLWLRQAADLGGVYGLSFVIVLVNGCVSLAFAPARAPRRALAALALLAVGALAVYGCWRLASDRLPRASAVSGIGIGIVQGNLAAESSHGPAPSVRAWDVYEGLTNQLVGYDAAAQIDVVVWPETTLDAYVRFDDWHREHLERLAARSGRTMVVGALDRDGEARFNGAFTFVPHATRVNRPAAIQVYRKVSLLPWAEYVPGGNLLAWARRRRTTGELSPGVARDGFAIEPGHGGRVLLATSICSEALQPGWFNPQLQAGASVLLNLADDQWFRGTAAPELHFALVRMRAVETRRWLVRASNSGISAVVDPNGDVVASLPFGESGTLAQRVVPLRTLTPYARYGDWIVWLSLALLSMVAIAGVLHWHATRRSCERTVTKQQQISHENGGAEKALVVGTSSSPNRRLRLPVAER